MIVLTLVNGLVSTKGYVSRYLIEISPAVYLGFLDAKTRDELWEHVKANCGSNGYATLVYTTNNAQGYEIMTHSKSEKREVIEYDGLKLISKKIPDHRKEQNSTPKNTGKRKTGWSRYSRRRQRN